MRARLLLLLLIALWVLVLIWRWQDIQPSLSKLTGLGIGPAVGHEAGAVAPQVYLPLIMDSTCRPITIQDPGFIQYQSDMRQIKADAAWRQCVQGDPSVVVAVIDTGVDPHHPDLAANVLPGFDFVENDAVPQDGNGHGTNVAGIIGAALDGRGVIGVAPRTRLLPVRVLDSDGVGYMSWIANGILYAADRAQILNLSLGGADSQTLRDAINYAADARGRLVIVAAGNCGDSNYSYNGCTQINQPQYPGAYGNAMAVAAVTDKDARASFSTQADYVDIAAPGVSIYSTAPNGGYTALSGTSQATPHVAGLAALVWARNPAYSAAQVRQVIESTAVHLGSAGKNIQFGWGRIDALAAVNSSGVKSVAVGAYAAGKLPPPPDKRTVRIAPGRVLVKLKPGVSASGVAQSLDASGGVKVEAQTVGALVQMLAVRSGQEWTSVDRLRALPGVEYAEPDYALRLIP